MALSFGTPNPDDVRFDKHTKTIILVEIADESFYFASEAIANADFTGTGNDYTDEIDTSGGLGVIERSVPSEGGFGSVGNVTMNFLNQEGLSDILDSKPFLENDEVKVYVVFDDETTLDYSEKVILMTGYIDDHSIDENAFRIDIVDASKKFNRQLPLNTINKDNFPNADPESVGNTIQTIYGDFIGLDTNGGISLPFQKESFMVFKSCGIVDKVLIKHIFADHALHTFIEAMLQFEDGTTEPSVGDTLGGDSSGNEASVVEIDVQSGSWGGNDAKGIILVNNLSAGRIGQEDVDNDTTAANNVIHSIMRTFGAFFTYFNGLESYISLYSREDTWTLNNGADWNSSTTVTLPKNTLGQVTVIPELRHVDDAGHISDANLRNLSDDDLTNSLTIGANEHLWVKVPQASSPGENSQGVTVAAFYVYPGTVTGTPDVEYIDNPGTASAPFDVGRNNVNTTASNLTDGGADDSDTNVIFFQFTGAGKTWDEWNRFGLGFDVGGGEALEIRYVLLVVERFQVFKSEVRSAHKRILGRRLPLALQP